MPNDTIPPVDAATNCCGLSGPQIAALDEASNILRTEANQLAHYLERTLKTTITLRTQEVMAISDLTPHRVVIAIRNEMERLRTTSDVLLGIKPTPPELPDED